MHAHKEAVERRLWQREGALKLDGVLSGQHQEGARQAMGDAVHCDLSFFHRLQQRRLGFGGRAVQFVEEHALTKDRTWHEAELATLRIPDGTADNLLLFSFLRHIVREYPGEELLKFDFLEKRRSFYSLFLIGTLYYLAVWVDKFIFWFVPYTSEAVIGPLRASIIYDLPIFLAYLFILPGMAVFLVSIEADFADQHERFYRAVREGDTLMHIEYRRDRMVYAARQGIYEIFKVQGLTVVLCLLWGRELLHAVGISPLYIHLFYIDVVAVSVQVLLMAILNVLFYLDARREVLIITASFFVSNLAFTFATLNLGAETFGYGFAASVTFSAFLSLFILSRKFNRLEYETFMLQN